MTDPIFSSPSTTLDEKAAIDALLAQFVESGYRRVSTPVLLPARIFLDQAGEEFRGRLYFTTDPTGAEFCLRPEFTVPTCLEYLASAKVGARASYSYMGQVFRFRSNASGEFQQTGLENFGRQDREAADAEILSLALEGAAAAGCPNLKTQIGDVQLFTAFLKALDLPAPWLRRIQSGLAQGRSLAAIIGKQPNGAAADHSGVLLALQGVDKPGAQSLVEDLLSIAGLSSVGGRSVNEIAERFLEQAALRGPLAFDRDKQELVARFLAIAGDPDEASQCLRDLTNDAQLNLDEALDFFDQRINFIAARGVDPSTLVYSANFFRQLDYYTGFVFESRDPQTDALVIGGGRYDRLLQSLGAKTDIPAVGAAIEIEALLAAHI